MMTLAVVFFVLGFIMIVTIGGWTVITVTRLKQEQVVAMAIIQTLAARAGLKELIDKIQSQAHVHRRSTDKVSQ